MCMFLFREREREREREQTMHVRHLFISIQAGPLLVTSRLITPINGLMSR